MKNRQIRLTSRPTGIPQPSDFTLTEAPLPRAAVGQFVVRNHLLSVDPAQRGWASDEGNYANPVPLGTPMRALAVGEVIESMDEDIAVGSFLYGWFGWQDYAVASRDQLLRRIDLRQAPLSVNLGALGINGLTAYLALHELGRPQPGETVLVTTAAGSVGSFVGQLAKAVGCRTIGLTGSPSKVDVATRRYGYDHAIDYRATTDIDAAIGNACPGGIDIFFDNVGGPIADAARRSMKIGGRIIQCGTAATATWSPSPLGPRVERDVLTKRLRWSGFVIFDHLQRFEVAAGDLARLIAEGRLVYDEDIVDGIEQAPAMLARLYRGENSGKSIVRLVR